MAPRETQDHAGWTDERVALLRELWPQGLSASQLAKAIGGVSRSAVIGKAYRIKLPRRRGPTVPRSIAAPTVKRSPSAGNGLNFQSRTFGKPPTPIKTRPGELTATVDIYGLGGHSCRWPIGDPLEPAFGFCGRRKDLEAAYCTEHARVAYIAPADRTAAQRAGDLKRRQTMLQRSVRSAA